MERPFNENICFSPAIRKAHRGFTTTSPIHYCLAKLEPQLQSNRFKYNHFRATPTGLLNRQASSAHSVTFAPTMSDTGSSTVRPFEESESAIFEQDLPNQESSSPDQNLRSTKTDRSEDALKKPSKNPCLLEIARQLIHGTKLQPPLAYIDDPLLLFARPAISFPGTDYCAFFLGRKRQFIDTVNRYCRPASCLAHKINNSLRGPSSIAFPVWACTLYRHLFSRPHVAPYRMLKLVV